MILSPSKRVRDAQAVEREWMRRLLREGHTGESDDHAQVKARLLQQVADAIDEKLDRLSEGEGLGIIFRVEIIREDRTFEGERGNRESEAGKAWRAAVLERDRYICVDCGSKGRMHAHHILPWASHPESRFDVANGETLCADCHEKRHPDMPLMKHIKRRKT